MPKQHQSGSQTTKDSSYRQNAFLSFGHRKIEEFFQSHFENSIKKYRMSFLFLISVWVYLKFDGELDRVTTLFLLLNAIRIFIDFKYELKYYKRLFWNGLSLLLTLLILESYNLDRKADILYIQIVSIVFHYIYLPNLVANLLIGLLVLVFCWDLSLIQNLLWEIIILYLLNKRARDIFIMVDSLKKQQKTFQLMIENSPNAIFVVDMNHRIHYSNGQAKDILSKNIKNYSEKTNLGLSIMMLFEEQYHEKLNHAIFDCTLKHETAKLFQIPLVTKSEILSPLLDQNSLSISPKNISFSKSILKTDLFKTNQSTKYTKPLNFYNISIQNTFWKGGHFFLITMESQEKINKLFEHNEKHANLISGLLLECLDLMEKDYQKWNNFQAIKVIKESDLKDLASIVVECNRIKGLVSAIKNINQLALERNDRTPHKFNIRNTLVQCMELISIKSIERKLELMLKFEESFPEYVYGEYEHFKQLIHCILRIINLSPLSSPKKAGKFTLFCKLDRYSEEGRFILSFDFEFESNEFLNDFFREVSESYSPKEPFNFDYLFAHPNWALDQVSMIPLLKLLCADISSTITDEKSTLCLAVSFDTSDQQLVSSIEKSSIHLSPGVNLINKKPLQLSFCRIISNVNNVIWREKPQAALAMNKQQGPPHKKKPIHMDFMKTSMKGNLISQLEKDKELKEKEQNPIPVSAFKPLNVPNPNNLNITKGTPSFEYIKKEIEDPNSNVSSSPSWKNEGLKINKEKEKHEISSQKEFKDIPKESSKEAIKLSKHGLNSAGLTSPSNKNNDSNRKSSTPSKFDLQPVVKPLMGLKFKNEIFFSQISEKEIETSKHSSARDLKFEISEMDNSMIDKKLKQNQLEIMEENSMIGLPNNVLETLDSIGHQIKGEFENLVLQTVENILKKHFPERISFPQGSKHMKRNFSDLQLCYSSDKPMIESPKSSLIGNKKRSGKLERLEKNQNKSIKKFLLRSNIIKSLVKQINKYSIYCNKENGKCNFLEENNDFDFELHSASKLTKKMSKILNWQKNSFCASFQEMECFTCQTYTQKRRWTIAKTEKKHSFEMKDVLIIGKKNNLPDASFSDSTYLRSLLNRKSADANLKIFYVEGYEQIEGYLNMKLASDESFSFVFLTGTSDLEEIQLVLRNYRECEKKLGRASQSEIIIVGKDELILKDMKNKDDKINWVLSLQGNDDDWIKIAKIIGF